MGRMEGFGRWGEWRGYGCYWENRGIMDAGGNGCLLEWRGYNGCGENGGNMIVGGNGWDIAVLGVMEGYGCFWGDW